MMPEWLLPVLLAAVLAACAALYLRIRTMEIKIAEMGVKISPLWARVQAQIAGELHHPNPKYFEMDALLEQLEALTIDDAGRKRLKDLLVQRSTDMSPDISEEQRQSALILILVMDKVIAEKATVANTIESAVVAFFGFALTAYAMRQWR